MHYYIKHTTCSVARYIYIFIVLTILNLQYVTLTSRTYNVRVIYVLFVVILTVHETGLRKTLICFNKVFTLLEINLVRCPIYEYFDLSARARVFTDPLDSIDFHLCII